MPIEGVNGFETSYGLGVSVLYILICRAVRLQKAPRYWAASVGSTSVVDGGISPRTGEQHAQRQG